MFFPKDGFLRAERGFWSRFRRVAGQENFFHTGAISRSKNRADIIQTADVVEDEIYFFVLRHFNVPREGFEPPTVSLRGSCSTN